MIPLGFSIAASTRIGNGLGMNRPDIAKTASTAAFLLGLLISIFTSTFLVVVRNSWGSVWTSEEGIHASNTQVLFSSLLKSSRSRLVINYSMHWL
jgi:Na+-driven multidrug efflux pump